MPDLMIELEKKVQEFEDRSKNNLIELEAAVEVMKENLEKQSMDSRKQKHPVCEEESDISQQIAGIREGEEFAKDDLNNLVIYGIQNDEHELPVQLLINVQNLIRTNVDGEISVSKACRIEDGPEAFGSKPVLATFEDPEVVEEILNHVSFFRVGTAFFLYSIRGC